jgi:hypothetical protein
MGKTSPRKRGVVGGCVNLAGTRSKSSALAIKSLEYTPIALEPLPPISLFQKKQRCANKQMPRKLLSPMTGSPVFRMKSIKSEFLHCLDQDQDMGSHLVTRSVAIRAE